MKTKDREKIVGIISVFLENSPFALISAVCMIAGFSEPIFYFPCAGTGIAFFAFLLGGIDDVMKRKHT